MEVTFTQ